MKKLIFSLFVTLLLGVSSCKYDDTYLSGRVDDLEERVTSLEQLCQQMNININSLQSIVNAMEANDYITAVNPLYEGNFHSGYEIEFAKSPSIKIYHGKNGSDGSNGSDGASGYTPQIGISKDTDGFYYWTLDGVWLLDDNGDKVLAQGLPGANGSDGKDGQNGVNGSDGKDGHNGSNGTNGKDGKDGVTPQLKIENDDWYVSYDNGTTWKYLGRATGVDGQNGTNGTNGKDGKDGNSPFTNIDTDSDPNYVIFTLNDGTEIKIPTWYAFEELKNYCLQLNTNIESLKTIVDAMESGDYITSCIPIMEEGKQIGYAITFAKGGSINIYNGKDGKDGTTGDPGSNGTNGQNGHSPQIGVKEENGVLYWTVDGEFLTDERGNNIPVTGKDGEKGQDGTNGVDGKTPVFRIRDGKWEVSTDGGQTWKEVEVIGNSNGSGSTGENDNNGEDDKDGKCLFSDVVVSEDYVTFTLTNGTIIKVPSYSQLEIFFNNTSLITMRPNQTLQIGYTVTSNSENINVEVITSGNLKAKVDDPTSRTGTITVKSGDEIDENYDRVIVFVSNGQRIIMSTLTFEEAGVKINGELEYEIEAEGKELDINISTNTNYSITIPDEAKDWITHTGTRSWKNEIITLNIKENKGEVRSTIIDLVDVMGYSFTKITINQKKYSDKEDCVYVNIPNGGLETQIKERAAEITCLTLEGHLNDDDFTFMNKSMPKLATLYMKEVNNTTMPDYCFSENKSINYIELPKSLIAIPNYAFNESHIQNLDLPQTVKSIGERAYYNIRTFEGDLIIPEYIISIGEKAFVHTSFTGDILIGDGCEQIGHGAFNSISCTGTIFIGKSVKEIPSVCFTSCDASKIKFGENLEIIGDDAFRDCKNLSGNLIIPHSVVSIGERAFMNCIGLNGYIAIGSKVNKIGGDAFVHCNDNKNYHPLKVTKYIFAGTTRPSLSMTKSNNIRRTPFGMLDEMKEIEAEVPEGYQHIYLKYDDDEPWVWSYFKSVTGNSNIEEYFNNQ